MSKGDKSSSSSNTPKAEKKKIIPNDNEPKQEIILYKRRFLVMFILAMVLFAEGELWMTFGSVTAQSMIYFNVSEQNINWFANIFLVTYTIEAIPCTFLPQIMGIKWTLISGAICNFMCTIFRLAAVYLREDQINIAFPLAMFGNFWSGIGQGFSLNVPSLVSANWFGENERTISTSIAYMANALGIGIGFVFIFLVIGDTVIFSEMQKAYQIVAIAEFVLSGLVLIFSFIVVRDNPPTPPSMSQLLVTEEKNRVDESLREIIIKSWEETKILFKDYQSLFLIIIYTTYFGVYVTFFTYLSAIVDTFVDDTNNASGYIGTFAIIAGGIATLCLSILMDKTQNKFNRVISAALNGICAVDLAISLAIIKLGYATNVSISILFVIFGACCNPFVSVGCEMLAEVSYPIPGNVSSNLALLLGNLWGALMTYFLGFIQGENKYYATLGFSLCLYVMHFLFLVAVKYRRKRFDIEKDKEQL